MENNKMNVNLNLNETTAIQCDNCNGEIFVPVLMLRKIPALLTGTSQPQLVPIQVFKCDICNALMEEMWPKNLPKPGVKINMSNSPNDTNND